MNRWSVLGARRGSRPLRDSSHCETACASLRMRAQGVSYWDRGSPAQLCACMCTTACTSNWHWLVCPGASNGKTGIQGQQQGRLSVWAQLKEGSTLYICVCAYMYVFSPLVGLQAAQPAEAGWGCWCCLCSCKCCVPLTYVASYVDMLCMWVCCVLYILGSHLQLCYWLDLWTGNCSSLTPLRLSEPAWHIVF